jgi:hypothetical protein
VIGCGIDELGNPLAPLTQLNAQLHDSSLISACSGLADCGKRCVGCGLDVHDLDLKHPRCVIVVDLQRPTHVSSVAPGRV